MFIIPGKIVMMMYKAPAIVLTGLVGLSGAGYLVLKDKKDLSYDATLNDREYSQLFEKVNNSGRISNSGSVFFISRSYALLGQDQVLIFSESEKPDTDSQWSKEETMTVYPHSSLGRKYELNFYKKNDESSAKPLCRFTFRDLGKQEDGYDSNRKSWEFEEVMRKLKQHHEETCKQQSIGLHIEPLNKYV